MWEQNRAANDIYAVASGIFIKQFLCGGESVTKKKDVKDKYLIGKGVGVKARSGRLFVSDIDIGWWR